MAYIELLALLAEYFDIIQFVLSVLAWLYAMYKWIKSRWGDDDSDDNDTDNEPDDDDPDAKPSPKDKPDKDSN